MSKLKTFAEIDQAATKLQMLSASKKKIGIQTSSINTMEEIWEILIPVLEYLSTFFFVPKKWKRIIRIILDVKESVIDGSANE